MKQQRKIGAALALLSLCGTLLTSTLFARPAFAVAGNLLEGKSVSVSAEYPTMPGSKMVDGVESKQSRWSAEADAPQWAIVDMGSEQTITRFRVVWESATVHAADFALYVSNDKSSWGEAAYAETDNQKEISDITLDAPAKGRYVKLEVSRQAGYPSVSVKELQAFNTQPVTLANVAQDKQASASSQEAASVAAKNAFDGNTTDRGSRWGSGYGARPAWLEVDLGKSQTIHGVNLYWERHNATNYKIQYSNAATDPGANGAWTDVKSFTTAPQTLNQKVSFDQPVEARFVRLYIQNFQAADPVDPSMTTWDTVSLYEMEVMAEVDPSQIPLTPQQVADLIKVTPPAQGDTKLAVELPQKEGFTVEFRGADLEQVVDKNLNIHAPLVNKTVKLAFKTTNTETGKYVLTELPVVIPGSKAESNTGNKAPTILPELEEWLGGQGSFTISDGTAITYTDTSLKKVAENFASDLSALLGTKLSASQGSADAQGIVFTTSNDAEHVALGEEGYTLSVGQNRVVVTASTNGDSWDGSTSANWGAQTLLQAAKQGQGTLPQGEARDYPLYPVRGIILDVGRKTFSMDWLKKLTRQMAYYKMNDLNVHLNDNLIPIETYVAKGIDPADPERGAYSGYRMESTITKGTQFTFGDKNFTASQDLTSKDLFYTKEAFKAWIKDSDYLGVHVSPEIDLPAHSLAITKVFPDLSYGIMQHRNRDHLDILNQYDSVRDLAKTLWGEFLGEGGAFTDARYLNIGADEFNVSGVGEHAPGGRNLQNSGTAYRRFVNDMSQYVLDKGYVPRVWGSLSNYAGDNSIVTTAPNAQVLLWNSGYAKMNEMYNLGYQLINCDDGHYYIVPGAGYYYDYLSPSVMYNDAINKQNMTVPAGDPQMVGGMYAVWNDMIDINEKGISEFDVADRINRGMGLFSAKLWGKPEGAMALAAARNAESALGLAPGLSFNETPATNAEGTVAQLNLADKNDVSGNNHNLGELTNASLEDKGYATVLKLNGGNSNVLIDSLKYAGLGSDLRLKVLREDSSTEPQVLAETAYGEKTNALMAVQEGTGKVGFTREGVKYSFNYTLPVGEWVELEFKNAQNKTSLFVNGKLVETIGSPNTREMHATILFPLERLGSTSHAFKGLVDDVFVTRPAGETDLSTTPYNTTMSLYYAIQTADAIQKKAAVAGLPEAIAQAQEVVHEVAPTEEAIAQAQAALDKALDGADYKKADYTMVDAYLSLIPTDLSLFSDTSVADLKQAVANVRRGLPEDMQQTVDSYEKSLIAALDGLELKPERNLNWIDPATLVASACTEQAKSGGEGPASNVLDGDKSTIWHTLWDGDGHSDHWIMLSQKGVASGTGSSTSALRVPMFARLARLALGADAPMKVSGLEYTPRSGAGNGTILGYQIYIQPSAGAEWQKVAEGTWAQNDSVKTVNFDRAYEAVAVKLVSTSSVGGFGSAAEIRLADGGVEADTAGLKALVDEANTTTTETFKPENFTDSTLAELNKQLDAANELLKQDAPDATDVNHAIRNLSVARAALRLNKLEAPKPAVNYDALNQAIQDAQALTSTDYTPESWDALDKALAAAKQALESDDQTTVDDAAKALNEAVAQLVKAEPTNPETPDNPDTGNVENPDTPDNPDTGEVENPETPDNPDTGDVENPTTGTSDTGTAVSTTDAATTDSTSAATTDGKADASKTPADTGKVSNTHKASGSHGLLAKTGDTAISVVSIVFAAAAVIAISWYIRKRQNH